MTDLSVQFRYFSVTYLRPYFGHFVELLLEALMKSKIRTRRCVKNPIPDFSTSYDYDLTSSIYFSLIEKNTTNKQSSPHNKAFHDMKIKIIPSLHLICVYTSMHWRPFCIFLFLFFVIVKFLLQIKISETFNILS